MGGHLCWAINHPSADSLADLGARNHPKMSPQGGETWCRWWFVMGFNGSIPSRKNKHSYGKWSISWWFSSSTWWIFPGHKLFVFFRGPQPAPSPAPTATESATEDGRSSQGDLAQLAVQQLFVPGPLGSPEPRRTGDENGGKNGGKIDGSNGVPPEVWLYVIFVIYIYTYIYILYIIYIYYIFVEKKEDESKIPPHGHGRCLHFISISCGGPSSRWRTILERCQVALHPLSNYCYQFTGPSRLFGACGDSRASIKARLQGSQGICHSLRVTITAAFHSFRWRFLDLSGIKHIHRTPFFVDSQLWT